MHPDPVAKEVLTAGQFGASCEYRTPTTTRSAQWREPRTTSHWTERTRTAPRRTLMAVRVWPLSIGRARPSNTTGCTSAATAWATIRRRLHSALRQPGRRPRTTPATRAASGRNSSGRSVLWDDAWIARGTLGYHVLRRSAFHLNITQTGLGQATEWPVGESWPLVGSMRKLTMLLLPTLATMRNSPVGSTLKLRGVWP